MAPFSTRYSRVGMAARMRVSSVMTPSLRGTFRSQRTNTVLPSRSAFLRSPTDFFLASTLKAARGAFATARALTEDLAKNALEESAGAAAVKAAIFAWMYGKMSGADCDRNAGARNVFRRRKLNPVRARSPPERLAGSARMPAGFGK